MLGCIEFYQLKTHYCYNEGCTCIANETCAYCNLDCHLFILKQNPHVTFSLGSEIFERVFSRESSIDSE